MAEREKIAQIIAERLCPQGRAHKTLYGAERMCYSRNNFADCEKVSECVDALIEAGFGDVSWWERKCKLCEEDWFLQKKQIEHYAESYKEMLQEDLDKYKHRAEVAERKYMIALNKYAKCDRKLTHYNKMTTTYDKEITKQAEREVEEEEAGDR